MEISGVGAPMPPTIANPLPSPDSVQAEQSQPQVQPPSAPGNSGPAPGQVVDVQA